MDSGYDLTFTGFYLAEAPELFGSGGMENVKEDSNTHIISKVFCSVH